MFVKSLIATTLLALVAASAQKDASKAKGWVHTHHWVADPVVHHHELSHHSSWSHHDHSSYHSGTGYNGSGVHHSSGISAADSSMKGHMHISHMDSKVHRHHHSVGGVGQFGNLSFLDNRDAFAEAMRAQKEMIATYMRNVKIRAAAANAYLNAKDREAAAHDVRIKFRGVLHSWIAKHSASIKAHKISARRMAIAWAARLHAEAHHQITLKELHVAAHHESHHHQMFRDAEIKVSNRDEALHEAHHWYTVAVANAKAAKESWQESQHQHQMAMEHEHMAHSAENDAIAVHAHKKSLHEAATAHMNAMAAARHTAKVNFDLKTAAHIAAIKRKHHLRRLAIKAQNTSFSHVHSHMHLF